MIEVAVLVIVVRVDAVTVADVVVDVWEETVEVNILVVLAVVSVVLAVMEMVVVDDAVVVGGFTSGGVRETTMIGTVHASCSF